MGTLLAITVGESYTNGVAVLPGHIPTDPTVADTVGIFIGDAILNHPTCTHLVEVAVGQAMSALKAGMTNKGTNNILDRYRVREPLDPSTKHSNDLTLATEAHVWVGFEGTELETSKSQFLVGAVAKLMVAYREHIGVGK